MVENDTIQETKPVDDRFGKLGGWLARLDNRRVICIGLFGISVIVMLFYKPFKQIVEGDQAIYDYITQSILRGQLPYRDIADIKWPASVYINAIAVWIGQGFGLQDIFAIRLMQIIEVGLLSIFTFLVAEVYLKNRAVGVIAALFPLLNKNFAAWVVMGSQPKLPLMVFGMLSLWLLAKDKPFWAGFTSMLACMCWQPGLLFTGTAGLVASNYLRNWRDLRAVKVVAGALIPLLVLFGYFYLKGAFGDFWAWSMEYNYGVFGPDANRGLERALQHMWRVMRRIFEIDIVFLVLSIGGYFLFVGERIYRRWKGKENSYTEAWFKDALIFPVLVYFLFCLINMQAGPDLIPFIPFIGLFAGWFIFRVGTVIGKIKLLQRPHLSWEVLATCLVIALMTGVVLRRATKYRIAGMTLQDQYRDLQPVAAALGPDDKVYVHGTMEVLVLLKRRNLNPYVLLDWGADQFAAYKKGVEFKDIIAEMDAQAPKIISLTRLRTLTNKAELENWAKAHYDELTITDGKPIYIRRQP
ncbi:MAG: DolP-mannose mannosyltransferase [Acidobacteria bacterium]|nr:DolP-mannose mannosyltransferase [Acidobacteriota bacterium]